MARRRTRRTARRRRSALRSAFAKLPPVAQVIVGAVGPVTAVIGTLLALGVISPLGSDDALANGARATQAASSHLHLEYDSPEGGYEANGLFDYAARRGVLHYDLSANDAFGEYSDVEMRFTGSRIYMEAPGPVQRWVAIELPDDAEVLRDWGAGSKSGTQLAALSSFDFGDPSSVLRRLETGEDFRRLDDGKVLGVRTKRYQTTFAGGLAVTAEIGVDDELVRRVALRSSGEAPFSIEMMFSGYGEKVEVPTPEPGRVEDLRTLLARQ